MDEKEVTTNKGAEGQDAGKKQKSASARKADKQQKKSAESKRAAMPATQTSTQPGEAVQGERSLISEEKFQAKIKALHDQTTIRNDKGEEVPFEGDAKNAFIASFEDGYPIMERALNSIQELGTFLMRVRDDLKPKKLYYTWLEYAGIPQKTAHNYVQVQERFSDRLPQFAHLGIRKLVTASRLPDCVQYVERNEEKIADESAQELERTVRKLRSQKKQRGKGRRPTYIEVGKCRIRPSMDGTKIIIEGITKKKQNELIEALKGLLL